MEDLRGVHSCWVCRQETSELAFQHRGRLWSPWLGQGCALHSTCRSLVACSLIWPSGQVIRSRAASSEKKPRWRWYFPCESRTSLLCHHPRGPGPAGGCRWARRRASQPAVTCCGACRQADAQGAGHHYVTVPISYDSGLTSVSTQPK